MRVSRKFHTFNEKYTILYESYHSDFFLALDFSSVYHFPFSDSIVPPPPNNIHGDEVN